MLNIINDHGNANENHNPIPVRNAITQKTKINQSWQMWRKGKSYILLGSTLIGTVIMENNIEGPQKNKI